MKKQLNVRLVLWVLGSVALLGICVHLLHGYQVRRNAAALVHQAARAEQDGQPRKAIKYLADYLTYFPGDTEARTHHAGLLGKQADLASRQRALAIYERLLRERADQPALRRALIVLAMDLGQHSTAARHLDVLLQGADADGELEYQRGACAEAQAQNRLAAGWYEKAIAHRADLVDAHVRLANLLRQQLDDPDRAEQVMERLTAANRGSSAAWLARGLYDTERRDLTDARKHLEQAAKLAPRDPDVLLALAEAAQMRGDAAQARQELGQLLAVGPHNVYAHVELARLESEAGRVAEAEAGLRRGLQNMPEQVDLLFHLAELLLDQGRLGEAAELIARLERARIFSPTLGYLRARVALLKGDSAAALRDLQRWRQQSGVFGDLAERMDIALARCYEQMADPEKQLSAWRRAVTEHPELARARLGLVQALLGMGRLQDAIGECWRLTSLRQPPPAGWRLLARLLILDNQRLPPQKRRWDEAERLLARAAAADPESPETPMLRAAVLAAQGQGRQARQLMEETVRRMPEQPGPRLSLADLAEGGGDAAEALRLLGEAEKTFGDVVGLRLARARFWLKHPGDRAERELAELERNTEKFSEGVRAELEAGLAEAYALSGRSLDAVRLLEKLARERPHDLRLRLTLFDQALLGGEDRVMKRTLEELRQLEGEDGVHWRYAEAVSLLQRARRGDTTAIAPARQRLAEAMARRPNWSRLPLLAAHLDEVEGKRRQALENYLKAIDLGDHQPAVQRRVEELLAGQPPKE
jgi:predicted Zn-dependent protease